MNPKQLKSRWFATFFLLFFLSYSPLLLSQSGYELSMAAGGFDEANAVVSAGNGEIVVAGTVSVGAGEQREISIIKLDQTGGIIWSRIVTNFEDETVFQMIRSSDGGYLVACSTKGFSSQNKDILIIKIDSLGALVWSKRIGSTEDDDPRSLYETSNGDIIVSGVIQLLGGNFCCCAVRLASDGTEIWQHNFYDNTTLGGDIEELANGDLLMSGSTKIGVDTDAMLVKLSSDGALISQWFYESNLNGSTYQLCKTTDGNFILLGETHGTIGDDDIWAIKVNSDGDVLWSKVYGLPNITMRTFSAQEAADGGFIIAVYEYGMANTNAGLLKLDDSGITEWYQQYGGAEISQGIGVCTLDDGYALVGNIINGSEKRMYVIKTDLTGSPGTDCTQEPSDINIAPWPATKQPFTSLELELTIASVTPTLQGFSFNTTFQCLDTQCCSNGINLLANYNPQFELPVTNLPVGFTNDNTYSTTLGPGLYSIIVSRNYGACGLTPEYDHTFGDETGNYLWFDTDFTATAASPAVAWTPFDPSLPLAQQNLINVNPNTEYVFSVWVRDLARNTDCITGGAPIMGLRINGEDLGEIDLGDFTSPCCPEWIYLCSSWYSGTATTAELRIESRTGDGFTDLGIDDVYFGQGNENFTGILGNDLSFCTIQDVVLYADVNDATFHWNDGSSADSLLVNEAGIYWVDITQSGCSGSDSVSIFIIDSIPQIEIGDELFICENGNLLIEPDSFLPGDYLWQDGSTETTLEVDSPGQYWVTVDTPCGIASDSTNVSVSPLPQVSLGPDISICANTLTAIPATISNANDVTWSNGSHNNSINVVNPGYYWVSAENDCGSDIDSIQVSIIENEFEMTWSIDSIFGLCGNELTIVATFTGSGAESLSWNNDGEITSGVNSFSVTYNDDEIHTLQCDATDICGNTYSLSQTTSLTSFLTNYDVKLPNIFSPNGDGSNDVFQPFPLLNASTNFTYSLKIFDRWGIEIFQSKRYTAGWNGQFNSADCSEGIYFYVLEYENPCTGKSYAQEGSFSLLR